MKRVYVLIFLAFLGIACSMPKDTDNLSVKEGEIQVAVDESFKFIADAQMEAYKVRYPEAVFNTMYVPEQKAIGLMLQDSVDLIFVSRELNEEELVYFKSRGIEYTPAVMATDAVVFLTSQENSLENLTEQDISDALEGKNDLQLAFDRSNSSNLSTVLRYFGKENITSKNVRASQGTEDLLEFLADTKNTVAVIGYNWISDRHSKRVKEIKKNFKVIPIQGTNGENTFPSLRTIENETYPFVKPIYLHTTQDRWGVAKGFVRFACSQIGQLVVEKMDLNPGYLIPKRYVMETNAVTNVVAD